MQSEKKANPAEINRLVREVQSGNETAFATLADLYKPLLSAEIEPYRKELSATDVEDLRQGAMFAFFRAALSYDTNQAVTFGLYAKICITNGILDGLRSIGRLRHREISADILPAPDGTGENPQQLYLDRQRIRQIYLVIKGLLSPLEYRIFKLYMAGFSYTEIAAKLEKSPKSVDNALTRIKRKIKNKVNFSAE